MVFQKHVIDIHSESPTTNGMFLWGAGFIPPDETDKDGGELHVNFTTQRKLDWMETLSNVDVLFNNIKELNVIHYFPVIVRGWGGEGVTQKDHARTLQKFITGFKNLRTLRWNLPSASATSVLDLSFISFNITELEILGRHKGKSIAAGSVFLPAIFHTFQNLTTLYFFVIDESRLTSLNTLPHLKHLSLEFCCMSEHSFVEFFQAQTVPFNLTSLTVNGGVIPTCFPADIIPKFLSRLYTLRIFNCWEIGRVKKLSVNPIWQHLQEHNIELTELVTQQLTPDLVSYIASHPSSTLVTLSVHGPSSDYRRIASYREYEAAVGKVRTLLRDFWTYAVSRHTASLESLVVLPGIVQNPKSGGDNIFTPEEEQAMRWLNENEAWGVGPHMPSAADTLVKCKGLRRLEMGSDGIKGLEEFIELVGGLKSLKEIVYRFKRRTSNDILIVPGGCANELDAFDRDRWEVRGIVKDLRWEVTDDEEERWSKMEVNLMPLGKRGFVRAEDGGHLWKMDF
ncbi:hypothetical protein AA313_de0207144 [Arthrobotrys entomopaga]|nr:hypothetical protein AA313_de0207144 [Arthrobotrys entomopaga]